MFTFKQKSHYPDKTRKKIKTLSVEESRDYFIQNRPNNLNFLLKKRYEWIESLITNCHEILEVGSGPGFINDFISKKIILTDLEQHPWIDHIMNAEEITFEDNSLDALIACNTLHHIKKPARFLKESLRVLRPNGLLIIFEFELSVLTKLLIQFLKIEGWNYSVDVYNPDIDIFHAEELMDANVAAGQLFFDDKDRFHSHFPDFKIISDDYCECLTFLISGGVRNKARTIQLPNALLNAIHSIDTKLAQLCPGIFALGRKIVLQKKSS